MSSKVTYRQQYTRCGKERCRKCKEGTGHGPYWYAYWSENGRTVSKYVGIHLPAHLEIERQAPAGTEQRHDALLPTNQLLSPIPQIAVTKEAGTSQLPLQLPTQVLRIYVLGQFRVDRLSENGWDRVVNRTWHRRRARALLGCLLSHSGRKLGREQIMEALWPELNMETAANRLNGAVHELRQILEPDLARPAASRMLHLERDVLELADCTHIWVDAETFESLLIEANNISSFSAEQAERLLEDAAQLYCGDYLPEELYSEWAMPRCEVLRRSWIGLLLKLSELREARGALTSAMEPLNRLLASDPTDETAVQRLMILLTQLNRRGEALNTYRHLATRLQKNYESDPLPETRELYERLLQGHITKVSTQKPQLTHLSHEEQASLIEENETQSPALPASTHSTQTIPASVPENEHKVPAPSLVTYAGSSQLGRYNQSPLIGRARELETMRQLLHAIEGALNDLETPGKKLLPKPRILLLMGEEGIGKTRLAEELSHVAKNNGWSVAWTCAYEQEGAIPYRPWIELLRTLLQNIPTEVLVSSVGTRPKEETPGTMQHVPTILERLSTMLPELRDLLPQHTRVYPHLPPEQERLHLWEATLGLLNILSKTNPLLLVLDDLHWTDDSSRELLAYLTRHLQHQRILLLGTCRDVELAPNHSLRTLIADLRREQAIVTLSIQPLTQSQIGSLVAHLPQHIVKSIQMQAAGNPFFAEELARISKATLSLPTASEYQEREKSSPAVTSGSERGREITSTGSTLPEGIAAVLDRRLSRLSDECQLLLGKAAVLGGSFELSQLRFMAGEQHEDTLLDLLEESLRAGLLTEEGMGTRITYHFWHPLIVSHLYERLSAARCAQLHRRAANALSQTHEGREGEVAASITHHLSKGGADPVEIAYYAELAGNQAYSLSAYTEAEQYYLQAVEIITHGKLPLKEEAQETALHKAGNLLAEIENPLHVARLLERVCECSVVQGNFQEARSYYNCILELRNSQHESETVDV